MANTFSPSQSNTIPPLSSSANPLGGSAGFGGPPLAGSTPGKPNKNQIITALYKSVLGRDPDPNALMYYISQPEINEDAVRKQMVESEEHKTILEEYKNIASLKKEIEGLKSQLQIKDKQIGDKQVEIEQMNTILHHKSQEITRVKEELEHMKKNPEEEKPEEPSAAVSYENQPQEVGLKKLIRDMVKSVFG